VIFVVLRGLRKEVFLANFVGGFLEAELFV
jgi:hypothetical protein